MDDLQFQKAEFSDSSQKCAACKQGIEQTYFRFAGHLLCPRCAEVVQANQTRPTMGNVLRGLLWGLGAAVGCSIAYAILTNALNAEFALASIAVGYAVGKAVRMGSRGLGGRRCQVAAVALTYFSITTSYVPLLLKAIDKGQQKIEEKQQQPESNARKSVAPAARVVTAFLLSPATPFLELAGGGISGILGLLIIFFGLSRAWRLTARDNRVLVGPYTLGEETGSA
jgi:hypothetical protein